MEVFLQYITDLSNCKLTRLEILMCQAAFLVKSNLQAVLISKKKFRYTLVAKYLTLRRIKIWILVNQMTNDFKHFERLKN